MERTFLNMERFTYVHNLYKKCDSANNTSKSNNKKYKCLNYIPKLKKKIKIVQQFLAYFSSTDFVRLRVKKVKKIIANSDKNTFYMSINISLTITT